MLRAFPIHVGMIFIFYFFCYSIFQMGGFACDICLKVFTAKKNLTRHVKIVHENIRNHVCEICGVRTSTKDHLERHKQVHENTRFECKECLKIFSRKENLKSHMKEIHSETTTYHQCEICGKSFKRKSHLKEHQKTHDSKRQPDTSLHSDALPVNGI